ncbi:MAG TPA: HIT domain-containing protein [Acidimicrobiales bacterium]|nr:HIT domain-containing protein [Acidimicrobiales bacterium]
MGTATPPPGGADRTRPRGLDRLWAGWRSRYVAAADDDVPEGDHEGSVFRRILASGRPDEETYILWRGRATFAILNLYPYTSGHVLLMPYREVPDLERLAADESAELWWSVRAAVVAVKAAYAPDGLNVGINLGEAGGAGVPSHLHVHVLPRWKADSNFMTSVAEARVLPESLGDSWRRLRAVWPERLPGA